LKVERREEEDGSRESKIERVPSAEAEASLVPEMFQDVQVVALSRVKISFAMSLSLKKSALKLPKPKNLFPGFRVQVQHHTVEVNKV